MKLSLLICGLLSSVFSLSQLKTTPVCPEFVVDILDGHVGELNPRSTPGEVKGKYPCFSSAEDETASASCGGGVFYKSKDIYFYTGRDYIEIGPAFKGRLSIPLMGAARNNLFKWLGNPLIKDVDWDAFQTAYGILILYYNKANRITKIRFSTESANTIKLCSM